MSRLYMGTTFTGDFIRGYVKAKIKKEYPELKNEISFVEQYETNGFNFYNDQYKSVEGYLTCDIKGYDIEPYDWRNIFKDKVTFSKKAFEKFYKDEIEKAVNYIKEKLRQKIIIKEIEENRSLIKLRGMNVHNKNMKKSPSSFCAKYMDKYFVYNAGIHQIVRASRVGFNGIHLIFQKPSGKLTEITLELSSFKRPLFNTFDEAKTFLMNEWIVNNEVPKYRIDYIEEILE